MNAWNPRCVAVRDGWRFPGDGPHEPSRSGCVGFEPYRPEVVSCSQAHVGVQGGGQAPQQADSGLGTAFFDALDLIDGHLSAPGQFGGTQIQGAALVVNGLAEGQCLVDGDPLWILCLLGRADPAGMVT